LKLFAHTNAFQVGGHIDQIISYDPYPNLWNPEHTTVINVHIVEEAKCKDIITQVDPTEAPKYRPIDPEPVEGEEGEINVYSQDWADEFDEAIESKFSGWMILRQIRC
jgi:hypothetical protein